MGYLIYQLETEFLILNKFKSKALSSLKNLVKEYDENQKEIAFIKTPEIEEIAELEEMLTALRWIPENNEKGDIVEINFTGEKLGDDYQIFNSIAYFVENDSFITFISSNGEVSKVCRWFFLDGNLVEKQGKLVFE